MKFLRFFKNNQNLANLPSEEADILYLFAKARENLSSHIKPQMQSINENLVVLNFKSEVAQQDSNDFKSIQNDKLKSKIRSLIVKQFQTIGLEVFGAKFTIYQIVAKNLLTATQQEQLKNIFITRKVSMSDSTDQNTSFEKISGIDYQSVHHEKCEISEDHDNFYYTSRFAGNEKQVGFVVQDIVPKEYTKLITQMAKPEYHISEINIIVSKKNMEAVRKKLMEKNQLEIENKSYELRTFKVIS